jgi:hypothetical protein
MKNVAFPPFGAAPTPPNHRCNKRLRERPSMLRHTNTVPLPVSLNSRTARRTQARHMTVKLQELNDLQQGVFYFRVQMLHIAQRTKLEGTDE